jgi:hypothetical protein
MLIVETKGDLFLDPPKSAARLKSAAAAEWCAVQSSRERIHRRFATALDFRTGWFDSFRLKQGMRRACSRFSDLVRHSPIATTRQPSTKTSEVGSWPGNLAAY